MLPLLLAAMTATPSDAELPKGWVALLKEPTEAQLQCANYSHSEWKVSWDKDGLKIAPRVVGSEADPLPFEIKGGAEEGLAGGSHVLKVSDGYLIGFDAGEFGGALWWFDATGRTRKRLALPAKNKDFDQDNVHAIVAFGQDAIVLEGLAHLSFDFGKAVLVSGKPGHEVKLLGDLGSSPGAVIEETPGTLLVLATKRLLRVKASGGVEKLGDIPQLSALYPNSMVRAPSGTVFAGMRHFVARITIDGKKVSTTWLVPQTCLEFAVAGTDCKCKSR